MVVILILMASLMLIYGLCEGVLVLRKITITVDDVTLDCLRAMRELNGVPYSAAIRLSVLSYYQDKFSDLAAKKNRPPVGSSAAEVDYYAV